MLKYLLEKEFKQLLRHPFLPKLIVVFPVMMMLILPWAANMEVKNVYISIVDNDHSSVSARLKQKIASSSYFRLNGIASSYDEAMKDVEKGTADVILEIPSGFEKNLMNAQQADIHIASNTVNGSKGSLGSSYLSNILSEYLAELTEERPATGRQLNPEVRAEIATLSLFNPNLNYKRFIVPALVAMLLTLICGFLPALNIVSEKEAGTIEQINVTPVNKFIFIVAKLIPYWVTGLFILTVCFTLAWLVYGILPAGSFGVIYFFAALFILAVSGMGLIISNHSATMQQAMFVMFFCLIILMLMSGLFTPVASMPAWAQAITLFNPLKYIMQVMRMVYLKGSGFADLLPQLSALSAFILFLNGWAVASYRKKS